MCLHVHVKASEEGGEIAIGAVALRFGLEAHVLRHWEDEGLISPRRTAVGERRYAERDLYRVAAVRRAKAAGLGLADIRALLESTTPTQRIALLQRRTHELTEQMQSLQRSLDLLHTALHCRHGDIADCPRLAAVLKQDVVEGATDA